MIVIIILFQRDLIQSLVEYVAFYHKMPGKKGLVLEEEQKLD